MRTVVTVLLAIVMVLIAVVAVYGATEVVLGSGEEDLLEFSGTLTSCIGNGECELLGGSS